MNHKADRSTAEMLQDRLRQLVDERFSDVSRAELATAMRAVAEDLIGEEDALVGAQGSPALGAGLLSAVTRPVDACRLDTRSSRPTLQITADEEATASRLVNQIHNVGGLLLKLDSPPELNREVQVVIQNGNDRRPFEAMGRVVYRSQVGTAIELTEVDDASRSVLRDMSAEFMDGWSEVSSSATREIDRGERSVADVMREDSEALNTPSPADVRPDSDLFDSGPADLKDPDVIGIALSERVGDREEADWYWYGPSALWLDTSETETGEVRHSQALDDLLLEVSRNAFSGLLAFEGGEREIQIQFDEGFATEIAAKPQRSREELGPMLRMAKRITQDELARAASHAFENEMSLERSLYELEILDAAAIRRAVAGRISYLMHEACDLPPGRATMYPTSTLAADALEIPALRVHVATETVIFRRRFERFNQLSVDDRLGLVEAHGTNFPIVDEEATGRIERAFNQERHARMAEKLVDGRRRLREVITASFLPPAETVAVVFALRSMGLVQFEPVSNREFNRKSFEEAIEVKHLSVHKASYFEVLNVHWSSYDEVVERAYRQAKSQFSMETAPKGIGKKMKRCVREISDRIDTAYKVLKRRDSRHGYRKKIMPNYKLEHAIPIFRKQAELAARRGHLKEAKDALHRILELRPDEQRATGFLTELESSGGISAEQGPDEVAL